MSYEILQSSTQSALLFLMIDSSDHVTGKTGLSPTVTLSKNGAAFGAPTGAVTEISSGWYKVAGNATDTNTLGPLALHATATGADPTDILVANVVAVDPQVATFIADQLLNRDMSAVTVTNARSPINAFRFLRNKWTVAAGTLTVYKEDDSTSAWTGAVTGTAGADPITTSDPA